MLTPGLVSITFRKLTVPEVIHLVRRSGLKSIEWGGDFHLPPGNDEAAQDVRKRTEDAGLTVAAYGSYYRIGVSENEQTPFEENLQTAAHLNAPMIRVWAGTAGSAKTDAATRKKIVRKARKFATLAAEEKISLSLEFHHDTINDTNESAIQLLDEIDHPNVFSLWQPPLEADLKYAAAGLQALLPRVTNVHVFSRRRKGTVRQSLSAGADRWQTYLDLLRGSGRNHHVLLEFVRNDSPDNFLEDAATLRQWLTEKSE